MKKRLGLFSLYSLSAVASLSATTGNNLLEPYNPGFEAGLLNWSGSYSFVDSSNPGQEVSSARHDANLGNIWNILANPTGSIAVASPDTSYVLSVICRQTLKTNDSPALDARAWLGIRESDASSVSLLYNWKAAEVSTAWHAEYMTVTPTANTARLTIYLKADQASSVGSVWWDNVRVDAFPNAFIGDSNQSIQVVLPELVFGYDGLSVSPDVLTPIVDIGENLMGGLLDWKITREVDGLNGAPVWQDTRAITQVGTFQWDIDISQFAEGRYFLTITTTTVDGSEVGVISKPLAVVSNIDSLGQNTPAPITKSEVSANGKVLVNGNLFQIAMLYGVYSGNAADYGEIRRLGFNSIKITGNSVATLAANVDLAWSHGLYSWVVLSQPPITNGSVGPSTQWNTANLQQAVNSLKTKPGLLGWDPVDEPDGHNVDPARVQAAYATIKASDPNHIVWVNLTNSPAIAVNYPNCSDLASYDTYPFPFGDFSMVNSRNTFIKQLYPGKPLVSVLQGFATTGFPSFAQLRALLYSSVCDGMMHQFYYSWTAGQYNSLENQLEVSLYTRLLIWEMKQLLPDLFAASQYLPVNVNAPNVKSMAIPSDSGALLILVNQSEMPIFGVSATVGGVSYSTSQAFFPGTSGGSVGGGIFSADLPAYGVGIYRLQ